MVNANENGYISKSWESYDREQIVGYEIMQYSLLSRFQGVLLGASLGEDLGGFCAELRSQKQSPKIPLDCLWMGQREQEAGGQTSESVAGRVAVHWLQELINRGRWQGYELDLVALLGAKLGAEAEAVAPSPSSWRMGEAELAIATLPITLFFHDNEMKRYQVLDEIVGHLASDSVGLGEVWVMGEAIAQALRETLSPPSLIPQIVAQLQQKSAQLTNCSDLIRHLEQVQTLYQTGTPLQTATNVLFHASHSEAGGTAIGLALYCFLSAAADWRLALIRAARSCPSPQLVCGLTGALLGAYHGIAGIPLTWRLKPTNHARFLVWGVKAETLENLAGQLLAIWSGVYTLPSFAGHPPAIAAPGVMRHY